MMQNWSGATWGWIQSFISLKKFQYQTWACILTWHSQWPSWILTSIKLGTQNNQVGYSWLNKCSPSQTFPSLLPQLHLQQSTFQVAPTSWPLHAQEELSVQLPHSQVGPSMSSELSSEEHVHRRMIHARGWGSGSWHLSSMLLPPLIGLQTRTVHNRFHIQNPFFTDS